MLLVYLVAMVTTVTIVTKELCNNSTTISSSYLAQIFFVLMNSLVAMEALLP